MGIFDRIAAVRFDSDDSVMEWFKALPGSTQTCCYVAVSGIMVKEGLGDGSDNFSNFDMQRRLVPIIRRLHPKDRTEQGLVYRLIMMS